MKRFSTFSKKPTWLAVAFFLALAGIAESGAVGAGGFEWSATTPIASGNAGEGTGVGRIFE